MAVTIQSRTPANNAVVAGGSSVNLFADWNITDDWYIYEVKLYWRVGVGTWQVKTQSGVWDSTCEIEQAVALPPSTQLQWYFTVYYADDLGDFHVSQASVWSVVAAPDTTPPTITSIVPAAGDAAPTWAACS